MNFNESHGGVLKIIVKGNIKVRGRRASRIAAREGAVLIFLHDFHMETMKNGFISFKITIGIHGVKNTCVIEYFRKVEIYD